MPSTVAATMPEITTVPITRRAAAPHRSARNPERHAHLAAAAAWPVLPLHSGLLHQARLARACRHSRRRSFASTAAANKRRYDSALRIEKTREMYTRARPT
jgi:hypothetical protein